MDFLFNSAEMIGTVAFAVSGAMVAIEKRMDIFGIVFLSAVTALGGGTIRDLLLGITPPKMFYSYKYLAASALTAVILFLIARISKKPLQTPTGHTDCLLTFCDALGLGIFAVVGTQAGIGAGYTDNIFMCVFLGMTTGVGGGVLRDMMCSDIPFVLRKHVYAVAAILGSTLYFVFVVQMQMSLGLATLIGTGFTIVIRMLAWHYRWNLPRIPKLDDKTV